MSKLGLFVDTENLYHTGNKRFTGKKIDYNKLHAYVKENIGDIEVGFAYAFQTENEAKPFLNCLRYLGFKTKFKKSKVGWSSQITVDIMDNVHENNLETIVICSSNFSMIAVARWLKEKDIKVIIFACNIPTDFAKFATIIEISELLLEEKNIEDSN
jgi:uncharacterized LabA/DUF88 family protein